MSTQQRTDVDPVTFEVIRHRLRAITDEQAARVMTVSGSAHVTEMSDYNVGLYLPDGSAACMGRTILFHAASMAAMVRHVIADCRNNPGINPGDMFIVNNPWKGTVHGPDLAMLAPVFHGEELIFWSGAMMHMADIGGMRAGSMGLDASETYQEGLMFPPTRMIEAGVVRQDIWSLIMANSRVPGATALDLKGLIAANNSAVRSLLELAGKYGADALGQVMATMVDLSERRLRERIASLPDARVRAVGYLERDAASGTIPEVVVTLTKRGDTLTFDYSESSPQMPNATNCTESGLYAGVYAGLLPSLGFDLPWNAGLFRPVEVVCPTGLICNADRPAAVSGNIGGAVWEVEATAVAAIAKLLMLSDSLGAESQAHNGGRPASPVLHGTNQHGERFIGRTFESLGSGAGAYRDHDGVGAFGNHSIERVLISNAETIEQDMPILYLWRGLTTDSGGGGRQRGGQSIGCAYIAHGGTPLVGNQGHAWDVPDSAGLSGGYMGLSNRALLVRGSDVLTHLRAGEIPEWGSVAGEPAPSSSLPPVVPLRDGEVMVSMPFGAAGWGDPLERDPAAVQTDLDRGAVSLRSAEEVYGCVVEAGTVDPEATVGRRERLRAGRSEWQPGSPGPDEHPAQLTRLAGLGDALEFASGDGETWVRCDCGTVLCRAADNWREHALVSSASPEAFGVDVALADEMEVRRYACPACLRLHAVDVRRRGDAHLHDVELIAATD